MFIGRKEGEGRMIIGVILIICGLLIAIYPPLLALIVAIFLIFAGILLAVIGYRYKKLSKRFDDPFINFFMRM